LAEALPVDLTGWLAGQINRSTQRLYHPPHRLHSSPNAYLGLLINLKHKNSTFQPARIIGLKADNTNFVFL
jgi:hypothetical protein